MEPFDSGPPPMPPMPPSMPPMPGMPGMPGMEQGPEGMPPFPPMGPPPPPPSPVETIIPQLQQMLELLGELTPDPTEPKRVRPTTDVLLERKRQTVRFWTPRNVRMLIDESTLKMEIPPEDRLGEEEIGSSEEIILNDPYIVVEKLASSISSQEEIAELQAYDPGLTITAQKIKDFYYWWRDVANFQHMENLSNYLSREEIYFLAMRGWVAGRIMLDSADSDFPYRYDLIDPIHVYPQRGTKSLRWVYHIYKDSKTNVLNDMGWSQDLLDRIEEKLQGTSDLADVEVASYYDDVWHVMFINEQEVWSSPHNYGFVPWVISTAFGPPTRRSDPVMSGNATNRNVNLASTLSRSYPEWWGVSVFHGITDIYHKLNKVTSAIMTEAMKAPNPPMAVYTTPSGAIEGKEVDTSIGAVNYFVQGQEDAKPIQYGFRATDLQPLLQILTSARDRGTLPSVMYGEGAQYISGFAVNLLQGGARDIMLPLVKAHEYYLSALFRKVLRMTADHYPYPIKFISSNVDTGERSQYSTLSAEEIKSVGWMVKIYYKNVGPQDEMLRAQMAALLVDKKIISLPTARGDRFIGLKNPNMENDLVLSDLAYFDPEVVKASIPMSLSKTNPALYQIYMHVQFEKLQQQMAALQMAMQQGAAINPAQMAEGPPSSEGPEPPGSGPTPEKLPGFQPNPANSGQLPPNLPPGNAPQTV